MENIVLVREDSLCRYYRISNHSESVKRLILKEYVSTEDGIALRALNERSKKIGAKIISNNIKESFQGRVLALSEFPCEERVIHMGRVLLVEPVDELPFRCVLEGRDKYSFKKEEALSFKQATVVLKERLLSHPQYEKINPAHFLLQTIPKVLSVSDAINDYFNSRGLSLTCFEMRLGIEIDEESGKAVPIWMGEGVIPQTANIFENHTKIKDSNYLAKKILPLGSYK
jgi:hypothetical protein